MEDEYFCNTDRQEEQCDNLDEAYFPAFGLLIAACQEYAKHSGCRFSIKAFEGIRCDENTRVPVVDDVRALDAGPLLSAKLQAVSAVRRFTDRLRGGEPELVQDLSRAFDLVIKESVRNSMIASCKAADFFPPSPSPAGVGDDECQWDEVGLASAPVIAQRLYNDEVHRLQDLVNGRNPALMRAKTASFIVEFADEIGVNSPEMPEHRSKMLQQFQQDLVAWTNDPQQPQQPSPCPPAEDISMGDFLQDAGARLCGRADKWLSNRHQREALLGVAGFAVLGTVGIAAAVAANRAALSSTARRTSRARVS